MTVGLVKVIVCAALVTLIVCVTCGAAFQLSLPLWSAVTVQAPVALAVTALPFTEQMSGVDVPKLTSRPEVAVALAMVAPPTASDAGLKLMAPMV